MPSVLITGCSSGFGLEAAAALARRGWQVFPSMRNLDKRERLDEAMATAGGRSQLVQLDVTDQSSIERAVTEVLEATGGTLDAVVHNAGVASGGAFEDVPDDDVRRVMETNFFGVLALTRAVLPAMRQRRRGRIVVVSSNSAFFGAPAMSIYTASKFAIEGWADSIAYEVAPFGIKVVCVEPGSYKTDIWDSSPRFIDDDSAYAMLREPVERYVDEQLAARARDPKEVGEVIVRALEARRPKFRYPVGPDAKATRVLSRIMPRSAMAFGVRKVLGLDKVAP